MNIQRRITNRQNNLPTLPQAQCDADLHLNLDAINADWFNPSKRCIVQGSITTYRYAKPLRQKNV